MFDNKTKFISAFEKALGIKFDSESHNSLAYNEIPEWDSLGHMALVSELEDTFGVQFTTDEVIEFSSFEKGIQLLASKGLVI